MMDGAVIWRGPSLLTGDPIFVVVTGLGRVTSKNTKTGPMAQVWILREDIPPTEAVNNGGDDAICGDCRHRSGSNIGRSCYVIWWTAPMQVWKTYRQRRWRAAGARSAFDGSTSRWTGTSCVLRARKPECARPARSVGCVRARARGRRTSPSCPTGSA